MSIVNNVSSINKEKKELATHDTELKLIKKIVTKDKGIMRGHSSVLFDA